MLPLFHSIYLETTRRCNLSCAYCSTGSNQKEKNFGKELTSDEILGLILRPATALGSRFVVFSGGEFLLREDAFFLLQEAHKIGYRIGIASNGTTLNQETINKLKETLDDNLIISLGVNSFTSENADTRDKEEHFVLETINLLKANNVNINISITIGQFNTHTFAQTVETVKAMGLAYNRLPFVPRNNPAGYQMLDKAALKEYFHPVLTKYFNGFSSFHPLFLDEKVYEKYSGQNSLNSLVPTNPSVGCWIGSYFAVTPEGEISPCPLFADQVSGGNIRNTPLKEILFESELFKQITNRQLLKGQCKSCKYNFTCGGCRVMAYFKSGDMMAEDPTCFIKDLSPEELSQIEKQTAESFRNYVRMAGVGGLFEE